MIKTFFTSLMMIVFNACGQLAIVGPECVLSGLQYQYNIKGNIPPHIKLCVEGGKLSDSSTCVNNLSLGFVKIIWHGDKGSISLTSDSGSLSMQVSITVLLQPGTVDSTYKKQF